MMSYISQGDSINAIISGTLAVACLVGALCEFGMAARIAVTGLKGSFEIGVNQNSNKGGSSSKFRDGELYEDFIEVDIPNKIGASAMKKWLMTVKTDAKNQGYKQIQIIGQRAQHSTSANPGSVIDRIFNLE